MTGPDPHGNRLSNHEPWIAVEIHLPPADAATLLAWLRAKQSFQVGADPDKDNELFRDDGAFAVWGPTTPMTPSFEAPL
jgi:hypothetical protein